MTDLQKKYNISTERSLELIALVDQEFKTMNPSEVDPEVIIKRCNILLDNEKSLIREVIGEYLKSN